MPDDQSDPFGRAVRDWYHEELSEPLYARDGETTVEHPIERFYFSGFDPETDSGAWVTQWLRGPLLDLGAGAGRHALFFQDQFETVALESSDFLVATMRERGVEHVRQGDMFNLRESFDRNQFRSALAIGTQLGLAASMADVREFLTDLATVTTEDATAVLDSYDPRHPECDEMLGWRPEATDGVGARVFHFEYGDEVGETLLFRFLSPNRFREAVEPTPWEITAFRGGLEDDLDQWRVALSKR